MGICPHNFAYERQSFMDNLWQKGNIKTIKGETNEKNEHNHIRIGFNTNLY